MMVYYFPSLDYFYFILFYFILFYFIVNSYLSEVAYCFLVFFCVGFRHSMLYCYDFDFTKGLSNDFF